MVKAPGRKMSPPSSCLLYQVPKKAKLPRHSAPRLALAAPRKAADLMPAALPLALAQVWLPPKNPQGVPAGLCLAGRHPRGCVRLWPATGPLREHRAT